MSRFLLLGAIMAAAFCVLLVATKSRRTPPAKFAPGARVRVVEPGFWADGVSGTIAEPPAAVASLAGDWRGHVRIVTTTSGPRPFYWVALDQPRRDADGDGPYREAEIAERALEPISTSRP